MAGGYDIAFSALFADAAGGAPVEVLPAARVAAHAGTYEPRTGGTLTLTFDNT